MKMAAMREILHDLSLGHLIPNFKPEKITPDIVYKLSLLELKEIGLQRRSEIMALRIKCNWFGSQNPQCVDTGEDGGPHGMFLG